MSIAGKIFASMAKKSDEKRDLSLKEPKDVQAVYDIPYASTGEKENLLDVYYPKDVEGTLPVIVSVHGGGYVYGAKEIYKFYGMFLAQQGFVFVNFNYHLAPKSNFPNQLEEINMVMDWLLEHAEEYHANKDQIFMVGDSAGAQMLSQYAAIVTNKAYAQLFPFRVSEQLSLRGIALNCGMYKISPTEAKEKKDNFTYSLLMDYFGKKYQNRLPQFEEMIDVLGHITPEYPPTYVMTAYHDFLKEKAEPMYEFLKEKGIETQWKCYGTEDKKYMAHVCHVNMNLEEAKEINRDECAFFKHLL